MTLAEFAQLLGTSPKWVLNAVSALGLSRDYARERARQLCITKALLDAGVGSLQEAFVLARRTLTAWRGDAQPVTVPLSANGDIALTVDVYRLLAALSVRESVMRESYAPLARGRPRAVVSDPLADARDWGLDLSLLRDNLRKSPLERLRQLDRMRAFARNVKRGGADQTVTHV